MNTVFIWYCIFELKTLNFGDTTRQVNVISPQFDEKLFIQAAVHDCQSIGRPASGIKIIKCERGCMAYFPKVK